MSANILDGKKIAESIKSAVSREIASLKSSCGASPRLAAVSAGNGDASSIYMASQKKTAESLGIGYDIVQLGANPDKERIASAISGLNADKNITAIIVQLPLAGGADPCSIFSMISPLKDAEGMHPENMGRLFSEDHMIVPPTAKAAMELVRASRAELYGKEAVIIGHSPIVGKPLSLLMLNEFLTVTVCHIATSEKGGLKAHVERADILAVAVGKPGIVKGSWVKPGAVVIDIGINKVGEAIIGDVEFEAASSKASFITPVPGGVGPVNNGGAYAELLKSIQDPERRVMIITRKKIESDVLKALKDAKKIFLVGCAQCATLCKTGGKDELDQMEGFLTDQGKKVTGKCVIDPACHAAKVKHFMLQNKDGIDSADAVLAMTCGNGVQSVKEGVKAKKVFAALDTLFLGKVERAGHFVQKCVLCGDCIVDKTDICPMTVCSKGLLNGPCGGSKKGKCEIDRDRDCGWLMIYNKMKDAGELDKMESYVEPLDHSKQLKPQKISV